MWAPMNMEINIIRVKIMSVGWYIPKILKLQKSPRTGIFGCTIQLIKFPIKKILKHSWQKKHLENQTGTNNRFKPVRIKKNSIRKNMKLGNKIILLLFTYIFLSNLSIAEDKIISTPLLNIEEIKPSFEEPEEESERVITQQNLKEKKN